MGKRRTVTVSATGKGASVPDQLTVSLGVQVRGATAQEVLSRTNEKAQAAIAAFRAGGVEPRDIATANVTIWPEYGDDRRRVEGYQAQNTLSVRLRDVAAAGGLLDTVAGVVGDEIVINGLSFAISDPEPVIEAARSAAMAAARDKAQQLARSAGAEVGKALKITEDSAGGPVFPKARMAMAAAAMPIEAGEQELSVTVTVTYVLV
jgi:uncharacterized protein YggE